MNGRQHQIATFAGGNPVTSVVWIVLVVWGMRNNILPPNHKSKPPIEGKLIMCIGSALIHVLNQKQTARVFCTPFDPCTCVAHKW